MKKRRYSPVKDLLNFGGSVLDAPRSLTVNSMKKPSKKKR